AGALSAGGVSHSSGLVTQPGLAANGGKLILTWANNALASPTATSLSLYARTWNGTDFVEEVPGDASAGGIAQAGSALQTLALAVDPNGHPFVAWDDNASGRPSVYVRGNTFNLRQLFLADNVTSIQSILNAQSLGRGDVIAVKPGTTFSGGLTITANDAGVLILGAPDGSTVVQGAVTVTNAANVILQGLTLGGGVTASNSDGLAVLGNRMGGSGLTLNGGADVRVLQNNFTGATPHGGREGACVPKHCPRFVRHSFRGARQWLCFSQCHPGDGHRSGHRGSIQWTHCGQ